MPVDRLYCKCMETVACHGESPLIVNRRHTNSLDQRVVVSFKALCYLIGL